MRESSNTLGPQVARKKFVDDFSNLAIEKCLLEPLPAIFTSQTVNLLEDSIVADIAAEDEISRHERILLEEKVKILQTSLQRLHALDRHHLTRNTVQALLRLSETDQCNSFGENEKRIPRTANVRCTRKQHQ